MYKTIKHLLDSTGISRIMLRWETASCTNSKIITWTFPLENQVY